MTFDKKAYMKAYHQTPEYKAKQKAYYQQHSEELKAKQKAYHQQPEVKAKIKAYHQTPEYKAKQKAYNQQKEAEKNMRNMRERILPILRELNKEIRKNHNSELLRRRKEALLLRINPPPLKELLAVHKAGFQKAMILDGITLDNELRKRNMVVRK